MREEGGWNDRRSNNEEKVSQFLIKKKTIKNKDNNLVIPLK
jgi:hypothetical protein